MSKRFEKAIDILRDCAFDNLPNDSDLLAAADFLKSADRRSLAGRRQIRDRRLHPDDRKIRVGCVALYYGDKYLVSRMDTWLTVDGKKLEGFIVTGEGSNIGPHRYPLDRLKLFERRISTRDRRAIVAFVERRKIS